MFTEDLFRLQEGRHACQMLGCLQLGIYKRKWLETGWDLFEHHGINTTPVKVVETRTVWLCEEHK